MQEWRESRMFCQRFASSLPLGDRGRDNRRFADLTIDTVAMFAQTGTLAICCSCFAAERLRSRDGLPDTQGEKDEQNIHSLNRTSRWGYRVDSLRRQCFELTQLGHFSFLHRFTDRQGDMDAGRRRGRVHRRSGGAVSRTKEQVASRDAIGNRRCCYEC